MRVKVVRDCCPCQNEHARLAYARERAAQRTTSASDQIKQEYQRACRYRRCSQKYRAAYMKTNGNANADASANNNTTTRINTNITERARRTPKIRIASRTRWASPSHHIRRPRRTHAKPTDFWPKFLGFLAQVFGIFGSGIGPKTWCRNCTKNLAKLLELMPKLCAEINSKCGCRKLVYCGAPIQNLHGPSFWCSFWTKFWDQVLDQGFGPVLDQVFGPIPEPKFPEN